MDKLVKKRGHELVFMPSLIFFIYSDVKIRINLPDLVLRIHQVIL